MFVIIHKIKTLNSNLTLFFSQFFGNRSKKMKVAVIIKSSKPFANRSKKSFCPMEKNGKRTTNSPTTLNQLPFVGEKQFLKKISENVFMD